LRRTFVLAVCLNAWLWVWGAPLLLHAAEGKARAEGLWQGEIVFQPAQTELDILVEIAGKPAVGTIDFPIMLLKFHPLQNLKAEEAKVSFEYDRQLDKQSPDDIFKFNGEVSPDGKTMNGTFTGHYSGLDLNLPFQLRRIGEAGSERPPLIKRPVTVISDSGEELRTVFNRDKDKVRLVMLISPTCDLCLASAYVVQKYVLDTIKDDRLAVYTLWGQMFELDRLDHAQEATVRMPDPRVTHFWAGGQVMAEKFAKAAALPKGEKSWDTFQVFAPGATWGETLPAPARYMFIKKPLPEELLLNGEKLADWIREYLRGTPPRQ
jgi:hypothetical protein